MFQTGKLCTGPFKLKVPKAAISDSVKRVRPRKLTPLGLP